MFLCAIRLGRHTANQPLAVLPANHPFFDIVVAERTQRAQHVELGVAHRLGSGGVGRLSRDHAERLQQMTLHHVAQRAGVIVVRRASAYALGLRNRYLHMIDKARGPDWLEDRVGEAEHHQILDGLLAEVMIDSKNLTLVEMPRELAVDLRRACEIVADWFFHHDAGKRTPGLMRMNQPGLGQSFGTSVDKRGRDREIVNAISLGAILAVHLLEPFAEIDIVGICSESAALEMEQRRELRPMLFRYWAARELLDSAARKR